MPTEAFEFSCFSLFLTLFADFLTTQGIYVCTTIVTVIIQLRLEMAFYIYHFVQSDKYTDTFMFVNATKKRALTHTSKHTEKKSVRRQRLFYIFI